MQCSTTLRPFGMYVLPTRIYTGSAFKSSKGRSETRARNAPATCNDTTPDTKPPSPPKSRTTNLRAASTEAMGACSHRTSFGSRMMSGSANKLYRNGCTSSGRSGPPRFSSSTPSLSSWPVPKALAAGVGASPLLFALPHSQFFPAATIDKRERLSRPRRRPWPSSNREEGVSAAAVLPSRRLRAVAEENAGDEE